MSWKLKQLKQMNSHLLQFCLFGHFKELQRRMQKDPLLAIEAHVHEAGPIFTRPQLRKHENTAGPGMKDRGCSGFSLLEGQLESWMFTLTQLEFLALGPTSSIYRSFVINETDKLHQHRPQIEIKTLNSGSALLPLSLAQPHFLSEIWISSMA